MKQTKLWLTAIAALLCSLTASADIDYDFMSNGICYNITSETTVSVTYNDVYYTYDALDTEYYNYYTKYSGSVVIPSTVTYNNTTYRVTSIGEDAFRDCSSLTSITIPESVTGIGRYAFLGCSSLSAVHIKDIASWCNVGFYAANSNPLYYAKNLYLNGELVTELTIPNTVTAIKYGAFYNYSNLTSITIPESVTGIGSVAFYGCSNLTSITIPENSQLTGIGSDAFYGTAWYNNQPDGVVYVGKVLYKYKGTMPANTSIEIKEGTVSINHTAFYKCSNLTSITIPESVTGIGSDAFYGCSSLTSITIPESVTSIGYSAFEDCSGELTVNCDIPSASSYSAGAFYGSDFTKVTIGEDVTSIGDYAFYECRSLTSITIPESVTSIGEDAFYGTAWYNNQPDGVVYAGKVLYKYKGTMPANTSIEVKEGTVGIGSEAFAYCSSLTSITIPENSQLTSIGDYAFYECRSLTSINIPESVTSIGESAFYYCRSLTSINIPDGVTSIESYTFYYCDGLTTINIPESVTNIGNSAFRDCRRLTSITIPESVTTIGDRAFYNCSSLTAINIPESVTSIGESAFYYCRSLTSITIPENSQLTSIGNSAFEDCSSLTSITIPESVTYIGGAAFDGTAWNNNLPDGVVYAGKVLYKYKGTMPENTSIQVKEGTVQIYHSAFSGCSNLTSITIPESVTSIGSSAFSGCSSLRKVINLSGLDIRKGSSSHGYVAYYAGKVITADDAIDKYYFYTSEESTHYLIAYYGNDSILNLPEDYHGDDYIIDAEAFADDTRIVSVNIPQTVGEIGASAFAGCSKLASVTIPRGVMSIGNNAFENCTSLAAIVIPQNMLTIGSKSFAGCSNLASVEFKEGVETIGKNAFANCTSLATLIFPESLTAIGDEAFKGCSGLKTILFSENIDAYGSNVFEGCDAVETMTVKGSVMPTVPSDKITSITLYSPVPLETAEFANKVYRNATVYVPQGSLERYWAANVWKNFWTIKEFDPTGIGQLTIDNGQLTIYDLKGRKIEVEDLRELEKGVYIINGRKVLIKD